MLEQFSPGEDSLGPYWEQPGISRLANQMRNIPFPETSDWDI